MTRDDWWLMLFGILAIVVLTLIVTPALPAYTACDDYSNQACTQKTWKLFLDGEPISAGDLTEEECLAVILKLEPPLPPFTPRRLECAQVWVQRQNL